MFKLFVWHFIVLCYVMSYWKRILNSSKSYATVVPREALHEMQWQSPSLPVCTRLDFHDFNVYDVTFDHRFLFIGESWKSGSRGALFNTLIPDLPLHLFRVITVYKDGVTKPSYVELVIGLSSEDVWFLRRIFGNSRLVVEGNTNLTLNKSTVVVDIYIYKYQPWFCYFQGII